MDSPTLTVNIVNPYNYYGEAVYEDFTMYIPYPNFKNKVDILKDIRYVLLHNEYDPDEDENSDKWFICNIVSSCYTTKLKDPKYDDEYDKLKGDFIGEFARSTHKRFNRRAAEASRGSVRIREAAGRKKPRDSRANFELEQTDSGKRAANRRPERS